uniref:Fibronectin type-II domain-containing protein n=1 Tax=Pseudonaja textilis TaxID=8673 RepID=A0A670ZKK9_PSETE
QYFMQLHFLFTQVIYTIIHLHYILSKYMQSKEPCFFPFAYKKKLYSECTTDGTSGWKLWCSLTANYNTDHKWRYCEPSETPSCIFPFIYHGKSHYSCTKVGSLNSPLCATTANYDKSPQWKYCVTKGLTKLHL